MSAEAWGVVGAILLVLWVIGSLVFIHKRMPVCSCDDSDNCTCGGAAGHPQAYQHLPHWPWFG